MKNLSYLFALIFIAIFAFACNKVKLEKKVPYCIEKKINKIANSKVQNPPAQIWEWNVDGKTYYYFTSTCCDQYNFLYDASCNIVCAPDGGFTGNGDGNCPPMNGNIEKTLVWKDNRTK